MAEGQKHILIIEDDAFLSSLLKTRFEKDGFSVFTAKDGTEALRAVEERKPDLLMLDLILPGQSGFEVLESMSADLHSHQIPIVIISNLAQEEDVEKVKKFSSVVEYFIKARTPVEEVIKRVEELLR